MTIAGLNDRLNTVIKHTLWYTNETERGELANSLYLMVIELVSTGVHY